MPNHTTRLSRSHKAYVAYTLTPEFYRGIALYRNRRIVLLCNNDPLHKRIRQFFSKLFGRLKTDYHTVHCFTKKWKSFGPSHKNWEYDEALSPELNQYVSDLYELVLN